MARNKSNPDFVENERWICPKFTIIENIHSFLHGLLNDKVIINIIFSSSMRVFDMVPDFEIVSATISSSDIAINLPGNINCKYYTHEEFSKLPNRQKLS